MPPISTRCCSRRRRSRGSTLRACCFFDLDGTRLLLDRAAPSSLLYLRVDNVHETLERLAGLVDVVTPPHVIFTHSDDTLGPAGHEEWQAFIRDSEGNTVGLVSFPRA